MAINYNDLTSNNNDLTNNGGVESSLVPFNAPNNSHSLDLESTSSQYAAITNAAQTGLAMGSGDLTVEAWIKLESTPSGDNTIIAKGKGGAGGKRYYLYIGGTSKATFQLDDDTTLKSVVGNTTILAGYWYHIAGVRDGNNLRIYVNGVEDASATNITGYGSVDDTADFQIGALNGINFFDGLIDDARVWSDARSSQEISDNMTIELVGTETNLVGYWKLNNDYLDETSNNNDLTASGSPVFSTTVFCSDNNTLSVDLESTSSQYLYATDSTSLSMTSDFSIEAWIKPESLPSASETRCIVSKRDNSGHSYEMYIYNNAGTMELGILWTPDGSSFNSQSIACPLVAGKWNHIAITFDAVDGALSGGWEVQYYLNGINLGNDSNATDSSVYNGTQNLYIGCTYYSSSTQRYFDGLIDEIRIWNDLRTPQEILDNFIKELVGNESGLVAYYNFDSITDIKSVAGVTYSNLKKISGVAIADVKKVAGLA